MIDRRWCALGLALAAAGCFSPRFREGATCDPAVGCPADLLCHPVERICVVEITDAAPPDAAGPGFCGDGRAPGPGRDPGDEECDDGNDTDGDGCDVDCVRTIRSIHAGGAASCAVLRSGDVRCWGAGQDGLLGHGGTEDYGDNEPASASAVVGLGVVASSVDAGHRHICALGPEGQPRCWGQGPMAGYPGRPAVGDDELPSEIGDVPVGAAVKVIAAGGNRTCAIDAQDLVRCWGFGPLGYANGEIIGDNEPPSAAGVISLGGTASRIASGRDHTCVVVDAGAVRCWGDGSGGQLGLGNPDTIGDTEVPSAVGPVDVGGMVAELAAGEFHTCALLVDRTVRCWGTGGSGQLGYGDAETIGDTELPSSAGPVLLGADALQITAGGLHTCALLVGGAVRCWGGSGGQLGLGDNEVVGDDEVPTRDTVIGGPAVQISAGTLHTCALLASGGVRCWGHPYAGMLGYGNDERVGDNEVPADVGDVPVLP